MGDRSGRLKIADSGWDTVFRLPSPIFPDTSICHVPDFLSARFGWKAGWGFDRERRVWPCSVEIGAGRWRQVLLNPPLWRSAIYRAILFRPNTCATPDRIEDQDAPV